MKFKVRNDFVVHHTRLVVVMVNGEEQKQPQTNSYYGGQTVEFETAEEALDHIHKLEPLDKEAQKLCADQVAPVTTPVEGGGINQEALANAIAEGVARAMAAIQAAQTTAIPTA
jgi:ribosomal protein S9